MDEDNKNGVLLGGALLAGETSDIFDDEGMCDFMLVADPEYLDERF